MRDFRQSNERRRRVRLIQHLISQVRHNLHNAAIGLAIAFEAEATRQDIESMRAKLIRDCRPNTSTRLHVQLEGSLPLQVSLDRPYLIVGSDPDCDLHLEHPQISAHHLLLIWIEGRLFCCQIAPIKALFSRPDASSIGRWVDEQPISVGPYRLRVAMEPLQRPEASPLERSAQLANNYPLLALRFDGVAQKENVWPVDRVLTLIGQDAICRLRLNHQCVAPVQACLLRTSTGCWLIDLAANGATQLNWRTVPFSSIDVGDELQLGSFFIEVGTMTIAAATKSNSKSKAVPAPATAPRFQLHTDAPESETTADNAPRSPAVY